MKPIEFKHQNIVFAKNQQQYLSLPALKIDGPEGDVISCWKMNFKERIKVLFFGKVWLSLISFNKPLTPCKLSVNRKDIYSHPDDSIWWGKTLIAKIRKRFNKQKKPVNPPPRPKGDVPFG